MKKRKPLRSVFLIAAEKQHQAMVALQNYPHLIYYEDTSKYACDNINFALPGISMREEREMFKKYFQPKNMMLGQLAWWPLLNSPKWDFHDEDYSQKQLEFWDHESRILALLLCAEMLRR